MMRRRVCRLVELVDKKSLLDRKGRGRSRICCRLLVWIWEWEFVVVGTLGRTWMFDVGSGGGP